MVAVSAVGGAQQDVGLSRQEVSRTLNRIFECASQEVEGHVTAEAAEETCSLMFRLYDRSEVTEVCVCVCTVCVVFTVCLCHRNQTGCVAAASLHTALIALSSDQMSTKYSGETTGVTDHTHSLRLIPPTHFN